MPVKQIAEMERQGFFACMIIVVTDIRVTLFLTAEVPKVQVLHQTLRAVVLLLLRRVAALFQVARRRIQPVVVLQKERL